MTVYLLSGQVKIHQGCRGRVHDGVLYIEETRGYDSGKTVMAYPLTSVERWEP